MKFSYILLAAGVLLVSVLFLFGNTSLPKKAVANVSAPASKLFSVDSFVNAQKAQLTPTRNALIAKLEADLKVQNDSSLKKANTALATFYKDSLRIFELYAFYSGEAAKLENSEKSLTFAAQLFLAALRSEHDDAKLNWETSEAIVLFERALKLNPTSADLRIGLGSAYVFGKGKSGDPQQTMQGIQQLLSVVREDSLNMKAQLVLAIGGYASGQYDKAIERFMKVIKAQPQNLEAVAFLADTYAAKGDRLKAIDWYNNSKKIANDPQYSKEVDERIGQLK